MLVLGGIAETKEDARERLLTVIQDGSALNKLAEFVEAQGGDKEQVYHPELLSLAPIQMEIFSPQSGYISHIACDEVGICSLILGGGRETKESEIDLSVGLYLRKKVGDYVEAGESLATIYASDAEKGKLAMERYLAAVTMAKDKPEPRPFIWEIIE